MKKTAHLFITGSVQSLFFREYIKQHADKHSVRGFVRNLDDGRVEVFLEGALDNVNSLIPIVKRGPQHAQIRSVQEKPSTFQGFKEFKVLSI